MLNLCILPYPNPKSFNGKRVKFKANFLDFSLLSFCFLDKEVYKSRCWKIAIWKLWMPKEPLRFYKYAVLSNLLTLVAEKFSYLPFLRLKDRLFLFHLVCRLYTYVRLFLTQSVLPCVQCLHYFVWKFRFISNMFPDNVTVQRDITQGCKIWRIAF